MYVTGYTVQLFFSLTLRYIYYTSAGVNASQDGITCNLIITFKRFTIFIGALYC